MGKVALSLLRRYILSAIGCATSAPTLGSNSESIDYTTVQTMVRGSFKIPP